MRLQRAASTRPWQSSGAFTLPRRRLHLLRRRCPPPSPIPIGQVAFSLPGTTSGSLATSSSSKTISGWPASSSIAMCHFRRRPPNLRRAGPTSAAYGCGWADARHLAAEGRHRRPPSDLRHIRPRPGKPRASAGRPPSRAAAAGPLSDTSALHGRRLTYAAYSGHLTSVPCGHDRENLAALPHLGCVRPPSD